MNRNFVRAVPILIGLTVLASPPPALEAQAQPLPSGREIVTRYVAAIGGSAEFAKISSIRVKGTFELVDGTKGTIEMLQARPAKSITRGSSPGMGMNEQGFDGKVGWAITGQGAQLLTGRRLREIADESQFDGRLRHANFAKDVTTLERTTFDKRPAYKVRVAYASGTEQMEYFDAENSLLIGWEGTRDLGPSFGVVPVAAILREYRAFGALKHPTVLVQRSIGLQQTFRFETYEVDVVPAAAFDLPAPVKALIR